MCRQQKHVRTEITVQNLKLNPLPHRLYVKIKRVLGVAVLLWIHSCRGIAILTFLSGIKLFILWSSFTKYFIVSPTNQDVVILNRRQKVSWWYKNITQSFSLKMKYLTKYIYFSPSTHCIYSYYKYVILRK